MKIGVLSYPLNNNYGNYLQAYALTTILHRMGHDVVYIHRRHDKPGIWFRVKYFLKTLFGDITHKKNDNPIYNYEWVYMYQKGGEMIKFFEKYIPHTIPYYSSKELKYNCQTFDAIVVGSDQVWRAGLLKSIEDYYLGFLMNKDTLRIAYAASFGKKEAGYTREQLIKCGQLIEKFKAVSVRESQGIEIIKQFGWRGPVPQVVLDPTLLLDKADYEKLLPKEDVDKQIFCYILDANQTTSDVISKVGKHLNLSINNILEGRNNQEYRYCSIEKWLNNIRNAAFVVTDSFHGTVFSILFNVPFVVINNVTRGGDRIISLLQEINLENRIIDNKIAIKSMFNSTIDWGVVNQNIKKLRLKALSYLTNSLLKS